MMPDTWKGGMMLQIASPPIPSHGTARREWTDGVTFREFRRLAITRGWTVEQLTERIGAGTFGAPRSSPYYEAPSAYLHRVLRRGHTIDDDLVIPYQSLIEVYIDETTAPSDGLDAGRRCACGCGSPVFGRRSYAAISCRMRAYRQRGESDIRDHKNSPEKPEQDGTLIRNGFWELSLHPSRYVSRRRRGSESLSVRRGDRARAGPADAPAADDDISF
jgi:hypothetical protein